MSGMKKLLYSLFLLTLSASALSQQLAGYVEKVLLLPENIILPAKLDTGAATSSLNVKHIKVFTRHANQFVAFDIYAQKKLLKHTAYPLVKIISIKNRASETVAPNSAKRPLINMKVCLGQQKKTIAVNLVNRDAFEYPFLLGRQGMREFDLSIAPGKKYLTSLNCG
jgi:hypothetical protein